MEQSLGAGHLAKVEEFADWYRQQPKVVHVITICETIKHLNQVMNDNDEAYYRIPDRRDLVAQYLLLYELSLPFGLDLNNQINLDRSASRLSIILKNPSTRELLELEKRAQDWLTTHAANSLQTSASGLSLIWAYISKRNIQSMLGASFGVLVLISFILIFALRSLKFGLLSLVPNLGPAFMAFGLWGLTIGQIGLASSVIVSLTLGIIVDDTVHFLTKYLYARRAEQMDSTGAVRYAFHTVGTPLWVTSAALTGGFLLLTFSGFRLTSDLGLITALTITFALLLDFLLLPSLLLMVDRHSRNLGDSHQKNV
jgi:predicted RND superfamily exporter protein